MLSSKIKTIIKDGLDPYFEGKRNFEHPNPEMELLAAERAKTCVGCRYFKKEPIGFLRITDHNVPELSDMSCGKCGCLSPYKNRQSIKPCKKWLR